MAERGRLGGDEKSGKLQSRRKQSYIVSGVKCGCPVPRGKRRHGIGDK